MVYKHPFRAPAGLFDGLEIVIYIPYRSDYMVYKHLFRDALRWLVAPRGVGQGALNRHLYPISERLYGI
jgi:hypothetical protein